ncbi:hypothetical protein ACQEU5_07360 [Marinactinospora thermotolerans]|uniref:hypothetical protein n=1 Tax=Marinactinospora thermotolerans TaxID=531310 RepID=UPI003D8F7EF9
MTGFQERRSHISREMERVIDYLVDRKRGDKKRPPATGAALEGAVEIHRLSLETPIDPAEMAAFKARFTELMRTDGNRAGLGRYLGTCERDALCGAVDGYPSACWSRSVAQIVNDEFTPLELLLFEPDKDLIQDIDDALKDVYKDAPPMPKNAIPDWVPTTHWWWYAPEQREMTDWERRMHFEYDWDDWR